MPYKSDKQRAWMPIHKPEIAKADATYDGKIHKSTVKSEARKAFGGSY